MRVGAVQVNPDVAVDKGIRQVAVPDRSKNRYEGVWMKKANKPHPLPVTVAFIKEGLGFLCAVSSTSSC